MLISVSIKMRFMPQYSVTVTKYPIPSAIKDKRLILALDVSVHVG